MHLHPSRNRERHLVIPVKMLGGAQTEREAWYLNDPNSWRQISLVRNDIRGHYVYEVHLMCTKSAWRPAERYANAPDAVVGVDLGPSTMAAVGRLEDDTLTDAMLVRPTSTELEQRKVAATKKKRTQKAQDRSRRATNPEAYGPDRFGRPGRGSRLPGTKLKVTKAYKRRRAALADVHRREVETRVIRTNILAREVVQRVGKFIVTEDINFAAWQRAYGRSMSYFAPSALLAAIQRESHHAGGTLVKVPIRLGLTQTCHCGAVHPKLLSERWHRCVTCGAGYWVNDNDELIPIPTVNRDVHSGYLTTFVTSSTSPDGTIAVTLDTDRALAAWSGAEALLVAVSGGPSGQTSQPTSSEMASSWSRLTASNRAGHSSDVDPGALGRVGNYDVGPGKAHDYGLRYPALISETDLARAGPPLL